MSIRVCNMSASRVDSWRRARQQSPCAATESGSGRPFGPELLRRRPAKSGPGSPSEFQAHRANPAHILQHALSEIEPTTPPGVPNQTGPRPHPVPTADEMAERLASLAGMRLAPDVPIGWTVAK